MIYTVTFNPSLDYIVSVNDFQLGLTNRTDSELILPGGKGINVSTILMNLGIDSTAFGFAAGFTGEEIIREVEAMGIRSDFIKIDSGISRINLKLKNIDGTEINGSGPEISEEKIEELLRKLDILGEGDILVLAGSIPASMPADMYSTIMERLQHKNVTFIVDATKDLLINVLKYKPFLIKPNNHELGDIFGVELKTREELEDGVEILHGDWKLPTGEYTELSENGESLHPHNKIYIFERGSQFDILREVKNSYMWVSPVPEKLRKNYNLVQKHAGFSRQMIRDVLIYKKGYQKKLYEREFIGHLKETIREMM